MPEAAWANDESFQAHLCAMYLANVSGRLQKMKRALSNLREGSSDRACIEDFCRLCHSFRGTSAMYGFMEAADLSKRMELELTPFLKNAAAGSPSGEILQQIDDWMKELERIFTDAVQNTVVSAESNARENRGHDSE